MEIDATFSRRCLYIIKAYLSIFSIKREILFILAKGKFTCWLKRKFCVASFRFFNSIILFVFLFLSPFTHSLLCFLFFLKIRVKSSSSHPVFGRNGCPLSNYTAIFLPDVSDVWRWQNPGKFRNVPFLLQNPQWSPIMNLVTNSV